MVLNILFIYKIFKNCKKSLKQLINKGYKN